MVRLAALAWVALVLGGCDDGGASGRDAGRTMDAAGAREAGPVDEGVARDGAVRDGGGRVDGAARDAAPAADGRVLDATRDGSWPLDGAAPEAGLDATALGDGVVPDAARDAAISIDGPPEDARPDTRPVDMEVAPDAGSADVGRDAAVDAAPGCDPVVLVPPPVSVDGEEVCNYVDDDGDGAVDEGFEYTYLYHSVRLTGDIGVWFDPRVCWSGRRFGMVWASERSGFVTSGPGLCEPSAPVLLRGNGAGAAVARVAAAGDRFGVLFHTVDPPQAFVQLFTEEGVPLAPPEPVGPRQRFARFFIDIAAVGDAFAVFAETVDGRGVYQLVANDGRILHGPMPIIPAGHPAGFYNGIGLAYDGETVALAWTGLTNAGGAEITFMTWRPDGEVVIPPTVVHPGIVRTGTIVGLAVIDRTFLILHQWWSGGEDVAWAALVNVESGQPEVNVLELGRRDHVIPDFAVATRAQFIVEGNLDVDGDERLGQIRISPTGHVISRTRSRAVSSAAPVGDGPFATPTAVPMGDGAVGRGLVYFGCGVAQ